MSEDSKPFAVIDVRQSTGEPRVVARFGDRNEAEAAHRALVASGDTTARVERVPVVTGEVKR